MAGLVSLSTFWGCVADRPSRNGVFNENQYIRKSFLVQDIGADGKPTTDPGWMLKATVTEVSSPNPLGGNIGGIFAGVQSSELVRFEVTQDKLNLINVREFSSAASQTVGRTELVDNAWPITNVDLKYRINLDGEKTNFYEENQELDWQVRQWVKINFAKNDFSDLAPFGPFVSDALNKCADVGNASATLVPDTFAVDEQNNYMQWTIKVSLPLKYDDQTCLDGYGDLGTEAARIGKYGVTFNLKYSLVRAVANPTYVPLPLDEKDAIRHKYGPFTWTVFNRDDSSGQIAAQEYVMRFDPSKDIVWYFDQNFPADYKHFFNAPIGDPAFPAGGIAAQTNALLAKAGAKGQVKFLEANDGLPAGQTREFGDVRYSFVRWVSDKDMEEGFAGVTQFVTDPRTGETLSATLVMNDFAIKDYYSQRIDAYLQYLGGTNLTNLDPNATPPVSAWADNLGACKDGDVMPFLAAAQDTHNASSTVFTKMQAYLQLPVAKYNHLSPKDMIAKEDDDFFRAYYAIIPYSVFGDPDANQYVIREGGAGVYGPASMWNMAQNDATFHAIAAKIDHGQNPFDDLSGPTGLKNATDFANQMRSLTLNHKNLEIGRNYQSHHRPMDTPDSVSLESIMQRDGRRCIGGQWETRAQWEASLISTYWSQVMWHEFGHSLGLMHNFMSSIDQPNFPPAIGKDAKGNTVYPLYASSVMEYNSAPDRIFWQAAWGPYDQGAIGWIYGNGLTAGTPAKNGDSSATTLSGQIDATKPWNDPYGFTDQGKERQFLRCDDYQLKYTPLCRQGDLGVTPSQIIANQIENYEWQYQWRNFRSYRKVWDNSKYADAPAGLFVDMRRFLSLWAYDWGSAEIAGTLHRIGINPPDTNPDAQSYYAQLALKFQNEISTTNQLVGAFHEAVIQQSSGERPFATEYDPFYGDELQQGIILDKYFAMQDWVGLWPTDNYDQNQAGAYIASFATFSEPTFRTVAETAVVSMIGGGYDVYPYFIPTAVALYAQDTHSPSFSGRIEARDWIGGFSFTRRQDFVDYFRQIAVTNGACANVATCTYDVTDASMTGADTWHEFQAPDGLIYIWSFIPDRNTYVLARKDRNIATYKIVHQYNDDVLKNLDDGSGNTYSYELPIKYTVDSFANQN